jgi:hypothetical protein
MKERDLSTNHQINNLKVVISFAIYLGNTNFYAMSHKDQILSFLDSKKKEADQDPDRKWITTWNYYLNRLKLFFRWISVKSCTILTLAESFNSKAEMISSVPDFDCANSNALT